MIKSETMSYIKDGKTHMREVYTFGCPDWADWADWADRLLTLALLLPLMPVVVPGCVIFFALSRLNKEPIVCTCRHSHW